MTNHATCENNVGSWKLSLHAFKNAAAIRSFGGIRLAQLFRVGLLHDPRQHCSGFVWIDQQSSRERLTHGRRGEQHLRRPLEAVRADKVVHVKQPTRFQDLPAPFNCRLDIEHVVERVVPMNQIVLFGLVRELECVALDEVGIPYELSFLRHFPAGRNATVG
jgi:hypothetical protein